LTNSISSGTILISSTEQASGINNGGAFTVLGGTSINKDLYVGGTITSSSDTRLKENIAPFNPDNIIDIIQKITPITYTLKDDKDQTQHIGFIAQEFQKYFPQLVKQNEYMSLDYSKVTVLLLCCIKQLSTALLTNKTQTNK
jgi:hypothetical protein